MQKGNGYFNIQISGVRSPILVNKLIDFFITSCRLHYARADKNVVMRLCYFENFQERALEVSVIMKITSRKYLTTLSYSSIQNNYVISKTFLDVITNCLVKKTKGGLFKGFVGFILMIRKRR